MSVYTLLTCKSSTPLCDDLQRQYYDSIVSTGKRFLDNLDYRFRYFVM